MPCCGLVLLALSTGEDYGSCQAHESAECKHIHGTVRIAESVDGGLEFSVTDLAVELESHDAQKYENVSFDGAYSADYTCEGANDGNSAFEWLLDVVFER